MSAKKHNQTTSQIGTKLTQAVQKEAAMNRPLPMQVQAHDGDVEASAKLADHDRLGNMAEKISIKHNSASSASARTKADNFANRVSYLPERLGYVETEASGSAVLRSTPETMRGRGSDYFEAKVGDNEVSLQRFRPKTAGSGGGRDAVPFHVTDDTLERLAEDAAQALQIPARKR